MPILDVKLSAAESGELTAAVSAGLLELTTRILGKEPEVTAVMVRYVDPEHWVVGGKSLAAQGLASYCFDIKITDETNTKEQKREYLREVHGLFVRLLGRVHEASYIHVEDVRAAAYGYAGLSQEYRYHHRA